MMEKFSYAIQSPFISLVDIPEDIRLSIRKQSTKVWYFLNERTDFVYYPVLTIFAQERTIRYLKRRVKSFEDGRGESKERIQERLSNCLSHIFKFTTKYFGEEYFGEDDRGTSIPQTCSEWEEFLMTFLVILKEKRASSGRIGEILEKFIEEIRIAECPEMNGFFETDKPMFLQITAYINFLIDHLCPKRAIGDSEASSDSDLIKAIYTDIHTKYGCYIPPGFWEYLKDSHIYNRVVHCLGLPKDIHLFDTPCVFIYPFLIEERVIKLGYSEELLLELFMLTLVHEHGHALVRHGWPKRGRRNDWWNPKTQSQNDLLRQKAPWIEEGIAMLLEFEFIESIIANELGQGKNAEKLKKWDEDFVMIKGNLQEEDLQDWPYYGKVFLDDYLRGPPRRNLNTLIMDWKSDPETIERSIERVVGIL